MTTCAALVVYDWHRKLDAPRPCRRQARDGSPYCGPHAWRMAKKRRIVEVRPSGGVCFGCGDPGRGYVIGGVQVNLCLACGKALAKAIVDGRG